ncbi:protein serine/threonine phosphatase 2C [Basidiobolus meristosporus CBS 931.73]|uniref:Protein serine/threonine phosphatase 2C n=1 Tax=Basidiobolus meristosporus CBS 931.73 TaxID=1314790 RepID=A0A1Y1YT71_9FUNG|nr:protein serine/threonine phosphatase 2C [Basidiobolus meristosporus CBS 931.73]|eukprot:ORY01230.1 protein serine/threonine phosphatase 2C [Basidiobolus meristosporus CBS 931.73]
MKLANASIPNITASKPTSVSSDTYPELCNFVFSDEEQEIDDDLNWPEIQSLIVQNEVSLTLDNKLVKRLDINHIASNYPSEDQHCFNLENPNALLFGVFDGHGGPECAQLVRDVLPNQIMKRIDILVDASFETPTLRICSVSNAIQECFLELDKDISAKALVEARSNPTTEPGKDFSAAISGSCAILAYVDIPNSDLYIANTGDSRAIIGVRDEQGWHAKIMSNDHTAHNVDEKMRMYREHPNEAETLFSLDRVLGLLAPTRAFGDCDLKWDSKIQSNIPSQYFPDVRANLEHYRSPPYISSLPEIQHHHLTSSDRFLVLASDGLYDELSNDQIVQLVASHLEQEPCLNDSKWSFSDENASTHLIRNAFGGSNQRSITYRLGIRPPYARSVRDDITVVVVFFQSTKSN